MTRAQFPYSVRTHITWGESQLAGAALVCWLFLAGLATAAEPALLTSARRALTENAPEIAIFKLGACLDDPRLSAAERDATMLLLAEAQLAAGQADDALTTIEPLAARSDSSARLLKANALTASERWSEALPLYQAVGSTGVPLAARLGAAECFAALGRNQEAVEALEAVIGEAPENTTARLWLVSQYIETRKTKRAHALLDLVHPHQPGDIKWRRYLEGRLALAEGHAAAALPIFEDLIDQPQDVSDGMLAGATLGAAEARAELRGWDAADKPLETFIWRHPDNPWLEAVFRRLDQVYSQQENPGESELQKWAAKQPPRCAALARYYVARLQIRGRKVEKAALSLEVFAENYPTHPLLSSVHLMQADLLIEKRDLEGAVRALDAAERAIQSPGQRGEIELRRGLVLFQQGQYLLAANEFHRAAAHSPELRQNATYDAALAALDQQNYDRFLIEYRTLASVAPESPLRPALTLEKGLAQARVADPGAEESLQLFLRHFPLSSRQPEARLALAELSYRDGKTADAARYLRVANNSPVDPSSTEHAEYLTIFLTESQAAGKVEPVIERALDFIRSHPKSDLLPEVRMKLGQIYFQSGNFASAETQFVTLAQESPTGRYAETALFLGGQAAMQAINPGSVDRALKLFDEVVQRDGPLKLYARQQQAIVQAKLGKESQAIILYDAILSAQPPPEPELRYAALAGKGENLLVLGRKDKEPLTAALAVFDQLAGLAEAPPAWRNQALYKKAKVLELLERAPEAMTALYDVLDQQRSAPREYFWFYKAGFDLAASFEQQSNWKSAIGIYEKMAHIEGPRTADATARARDLRLKHFIWE